MSKNPFKSRSPNADRVRGPERKQPPGGMKRIGDDMVSNMIRDVVDAWERGKISVDYDDEAMANIGAMFIRVAALARSVLLNTEELFENPAVKAFIAEHGTKAIVDLASNLSGAADEQYGEIVAAVAGAYAKIVSGMMALFHGKNHLDQAFTQATTAGALLATGAMTLQATGRNPDHPSGD